MMSLPTMRGSTRRDPGTEVTVMASRLELRRYRDVASFLVAALRLRRHFPSVPGGVGLGLRAEPLRRRFWTLSTWSDGDALQRFTADPMHVAVMEHFRDRMAGSAFVTWSETSDREPDWASATNLLADPTRPTR
jgi:hypothetical protein